MYLSVLAAANSAVLDLTFTDAFLPTIADWILARVEVVA